MMRRSNDSLRLTPSQQVDETSILNFEHARDAALRSIRRKLRSHSVKIDTIIHMCQEIDKNNDGLIHTDDLMDIIRQLLPENSISNRELRHLAAELSHGRRVVVLEYRRLESILGDDPRESHEKNDNVEKWFDESDRIEAESWATQSGTLGEWLQKAACPAEQKNFMRFINCLERYERDSGMRIVTQDDGFLIPLGPDLRASIRIFMA